MLAKYKTEATCIKFHLRWEIQQDKETQTESKKVKIGKQIKIHKQWLMQHFFLLFTVLSLWPTAGGLTLSLKAIISCDKCNVLSFISLLDFKGIIHNIRCCIVSQLKVYVLLSYNMRKISYWGHHVENGHGTCMRKYLKGLHYITGLSHKHVVVAAILMLNISHINLSSETSISYQCVWWNELPLCRNFLVMMTKQVVYVFFSSLSRTARD